MRSFRLGSLFGIPLLIHPGWFVIAALTTWILTGRVFPSILPEADRSTHVAMAVVSTLIFFASIVLHELAHSLVARRYGIPVRSITLFLFGGVAHITREAVRPFNELAMAAAGPLFSLVLGAIFLGGWWLAGGNTGSPAGVTVFWAGWMNVVLGVFNLLPAFPMDGGRIFRSVIWLVSGNHHRATIVAGRVGRGFAWLLAGAGIVAVAGVDVVLVAGPLGGVWLILIGVFLENGARRSLEQLGLVRELERYNASDLMLVDPPIADANRTLAGVARGVLDLNPRVCFFVEERGALAGLLSAFEFRTVPEALWDRVTVREAMIPSSRLRAVGPETRLSDVLLAMEDDSSMHAPVVDHGRVVGIIGRERIVMVLRHAGLVDAH